MTIQETQDKIISEFKISDDWFERNDYLIKLGRSLPSMDPKYKTEENLIKGCQVKTWFHSTCKDERIFYDIDSSSVTIRGIIALLLSIFSGQRAEDIKNTDLYFIDRVGLQDNFSPLRANSLWKLVNRIKTEATQRADKN